MATEDDKKRFLEEFAKYCSVVSAAKTVGIARTLIYYWIEKDNEFAKKFEKILHDRGTLAVDTLYTRAIRLLTVGGAVNAQAGARCLELWMRNQGMLVDKHEVDIGTVEISFSPEADKEKADE